MYAHCTLIAYRHVSTQHVLSRRLIFQFMEETMSTSTPPPNAGSQPAPKKSSERKIEANRKNALRSTGPKDTISTRFNAAKHGLLVVGVTELDDAEGYRAMLRDLKQEKNPVGPIEVFLVDSAALDMTRLRRAMRLVAEY